MTTRDDLLSRHVQQLVERFGSYVDGYDRRNPFDRARQLSGHVRTLRIRSEFSSAAEAVRRERFLGNLHDTLQAWGIGVRTRSQFHSPTSSRPFMITRPISPRSTD